MSSPYNKSKSWPGFSSLQGTAIQAYGQERHSLYLTASLTKDFTIGRSTVSKSGLFRSNDRKTFEHIGFHHPRIDSAAFDPRHAGVFYLAVLNGVLGTRDGVASWRILTGWNMTEPKDVAVDPHSPDRIYAALPDGIIVSHDQGKNWAYKDKGIERKYTQVIALDRTRPNRIIAGTELGIYVSKDGAENWDLVLPTHATVNDIVQSPLKTKVFLAVTQSDGAWISGNRGLTWKAFKDIGDEHTLHNAAFHPKDSKRMAICGWGAGVMITEDGGNTWQQRSEGLPSENIWSLAIDPDFSNRIYANPYQEAVYVSDDFGRSWGPFVFEGALVWDYKFIPETKP